MNLLDIYSLGLSEEKAKTLIMSEGYNELPCSQKRGAFFIALSVVKEPMFLLLLACGTLYFLSGEIQEAIMLLGFVFVIMAITIFQENKTERALEALKDMSSPRALVIRDGEKKRIPGREVVRGDIFLLSEGDRIPADAFLFSATNLLVDESLLTGEAVPVRKVEGKIPNEIKHPGGDDLPFVYSGTLVVQGQGIAKVQEIGSSTEMGKIGKALQRIQEEKTPLQRETGKLVNFFACVGFALCLLIVVVFGLTRGNWLQGFLAGLSLAMAMLPEEFPVVLTIFLAIGAWRISRHKVLTRRIPAVETLGSATVLCVDKTGTLTMNKMKVSDLCVEGKFIKILPQMEELPEEFHELVEYSILASPADPFDPMEKAMKSLGEQCLAKTEHLHHDWELLKEYPLSCELLAMSRVWRSKNRENFIIAAKGAPEAIADICHFSQEQIQKMTKNIDILSCKGRRVIAVAAAEFQQKKLPDDQHVFSFNFIGLLGLEDPVRPEVPEAIEKCYEAGVRTIMITGDYPGTATNIAEQIGLKSSENIITGHDLQNMSNKEFQERICSVNIFARMVPEQKLRLVEALKYHGEIVAMTGDGVNDAPALKAAHIGIAMGARGTDVAREASSLVLLEDDFSSIVQAVFMGRRIYDNLKKAMIYIASVHIPIAGMSLIPVLMKWPIALYPVHIVFMELIIDPACSIIFEAEEAEKDIMKRSPRQLSESLFDSKAIMVSLMQGLIILFITAIVYCWNITYSEEHIARTLCFITLVLCNIGLILTNRSYSRCILSMISVPNYALWWIITGTLFMLASSLFLPFFQNLFQFASISYTDFLFSFTAGIIAIVLMECLKIPFIQKKLSFSKKTKI